MANEGLGALLKLLGVGHVINNMLLQITPQHMCGDVDNSRHVCLLV